MVQDIDHDNIRDRAVRERQVLRVRDAIEPWGELDVRRDDIRQSLLQISDPAADFDRKARCAGGDDAIVKIIVDSPQNRFAVPRRQVLVQRLGHFAYTALIRRNANNTMRSSIRPCRKREICVSP